MVPGDPCSAPGRGLQARASAPARQRSWERERRGRSLGPPTVSGQADPGGAHPPRGPDNAPGARERGQRPLGVGAPEQDAPQKHSGGDWCRWEPSRTGKRTSQGRRRGTRRCRGGAWGSSSGRRHGTLVAPVSCPQKHPPQPCHHAGTPGGAATRPLHGSAPILTTARDTPRVSGRRGPCAARGGWSLGSASRGAVRPRERVRGHFTSRFRRGGRETLTSEPQAQDGLPPASTPGEPGRPKPGERVTRGARSAQVTDSGRASVAEWGGVVGTGLREPRG